MKIIILCLAVMTSLRAQEAHYTSEGQKFAFETVPKRGEVIWGLDFLPGGELLFTERSGKLFSFDEGKKRLTEITGVPKVHALGQGGLLDVKLHPNFAGNALVYLTYSSPEKGGSTTVLAKHAAAAASTASPPWASIL